MQKRPLLGLTLAELQNVVKNLGMPGFSAKQIASWLYDKKVASIQPDYQPNQFVARKGQADQCGNDGHGRTT